MPELGLSGMPMFLIFRMQVMRNPQAAEQKFVKLKDIAAETLKDPAKMKVAEPDGISTR